MTPAGSCGVFRRGFLRLTRGDGNADGSWNARRHRMRDPACVQIITLPGVNYRKKESFQLALGA